jgi:hypothetical protein
VFITRLTHGALIVQHLLLFLLSRIQKIEFWKVFAGSDKFVNWP